MAKITEKYEALIVLNTKAGEEAVKALIEKITALVSANATVNSVDDWGKRRLAYPIQDETDGYYVLYNFTAQAAFPAELDRVLKITDGVLRSLITIYLEEPTKADKPKAAASVSETATAE